MMSFASTPLSAMPEAFKSCPSLMNSSPERSLNFSIIPLLFRLIRLYGRVKINRKDQVNITLGLIFDETRCLGIHEIQIDFIIIDYSQSIDQELGVESDEKVFAFFCAQYHLIHGAELRFDLKF